LGFVPGKRALDAGCGEGYGADLLAQKARPIIAIDSDKKAIQQARQRYQKPNLIFQKKDVAEC
jgi:2-polyprenyl-3-methyl-5-hydroxy-6-metoxy-1,4-benzoquinol methylase